MGNSLQEQGKLEEAIEAYNEALVIKPEFSDAYFNKGTALHAQCKPEEAIASYKKGLAIKPDYGKAKHMLSSLMGITTNSAPLEYIENLFDGYANKFDSSLVGKLEYNIPKMLTQMIFKEQPNVSLGSVLDLGCGTGLTGLEIKRFYTKLYGIDLSSSMLEQARLKNVYDKLTHIDIVEYLSGSELDFDYFISTDVFNYFGQLSEVFHLIKSRNKQSGKLIFSTEHNDGHGFRLEKSGRYSHSTGYIESLCNEFSYSISHFSKTDLRKEKGEFLTGGLYVLNF
jgi:predicted TPR repeat methyltransferase